MASLIQMGRMGFLHGNSAWKLAILLALLVFFVGVGIAHVINPDRFMKRSGVRRGGEMLTEWNRLGFQLAGALFAGVAAYGLYVLLRDILAG
jgi:hypothetical protein